ncbi:MAG: AbrB/MazE/SpoVT family DNA-binding domain-containing protein [Euryarchaeota archaeon]|nr:AbrB/MazE/SpoVT family DNA-binding domain-containing protein [Euryarchaeota archaeon]
MTGRKPLKVFSTLGKLHVIIPEEIASAMNINPGDEVVWSVERGELVLRKVWKDN